MKQSKLCVLCYVSEFKCSKDIRNQKPGLGPCLSYKIFRISLLRQQWFAMEPPKRGFMEFFYRRDGLLLKNWTLSSSLSLFLVKYSFLNLFLVLVHMQFPIKCHYIHTSRQRKASYILQRSLFLVLVHMQFPIKCHYIHTSRQRKASYILQRSQSGRDCPFLV